MPAFVRPQRFPFASKGMNLSAPVDTLPPDKYRLLQNVRAYGQNQIQMRQGLEKIVDLTPDVPFSIKSFNDPILPPVQYPTSFGGVRTTPAHVRLYGAGTFGASTLYIGVSSGGVEPTDADPVQDSSGATYIFSGYPMTFAVFKPDLNNRPWCVVADMDQTIKVSSNAVGFRIGVAPPPFQALAVLSAVNADGPDIGTTGRPYDYRFVARADPLLGTGCISNPGPPMFPEPEPTVTDGSVVSPMGQNVTVSTPNVHPDPQVRYLDVYRFGGALPEWIYIGTINNVVGVGGSMEDIYPDSAIASNPRLEFDNNQPWLTVDQPASGGCTITPLATGNGAVITLSATDSGGLPSTPFKEWSIDDPYWVAGNTITIDGTAFTLRRAPMDENNLEVIEDPGVITGGDWLIAAPEMAHVSLPYWWGPFGTGETGTFYFACGDPNRPGALYWTKGNNPESHPGTNVLDITSPSEPLMNGCMYDGKTYVLSCDRPFSVYPSFGGVSDFSAVEIPNSPGLFSHWAIASGPRVWYRAKDGIYELSSGAPVNITNADLYPVFPHEGDSATAFQTPGGFKTNSVGGTLAPLPVNDEEPFAQKLCFGDGFLYFDYTDTDGTPLTWVLDVYGGGGFYHDVYSTGVRVHYYEESVNGSDAGTHNILCGSDRASISVMGGTSDESEPIICRIRTGSRDMGDARPRKFFGDIQVDFDSSCSVIDCQLGFDNYTFFSIISLAGENLTGRRRSIGDINNGLGQFAFNIGLDLTWTTDSDIPVFYSWEPSLVPKPEVTAKRVTDWENAGYDGAKFIQGFRITADTIGATRQIQMQSDAGVVEQTFDVLTSGEQTLAYSFETPFISHLLRALPTDQNFWRLFRIEWIWEPAPELVPVWKTQEGTLGFPDWFYHRDAYLAIVSTGITTFTANVDGTAFPYTIGTTAGAYRKPYVRLSPMKGKSVSYFVTCPTGLRLFKNDCTVRVGAWGRQDNFRVVQPFGDLSFVSGAKI